MFAFFRFHYFVFSFSNSLIFRFIFIRISMRIFFFFIHFVFFYQFSSRFGWIPTTSFRLCPMPVEHLIEFEIIFRVPKSSTMTLIINYRMNVRIEGRHTIKEKLLSNKISITTVRNATKDFQVINRNFYFVRNAEYQI